MNIEKTKSVPVITYRKIIFQLVLLCSIGLECYSHSRGKQNNQQLNECRRQSQMSPNVCFPSGRVAYSNYPSMSTHAPGSIRILPPRSIHRRPSSNKMHTFTSNDGSKVKARLLSINATNKTARIQTEKGMACNVPIARFCSTDVKYLKSWWDQRHPH